MKEKFTTRLRRASGPELDLVAAEVSVLRYRNYTPSTDQTHVEEDAFLRERVLAAWNARANRPGPTMLNDPRRDPLYGEWRCTRCGAEANTPDRFSCRQGGDCDFERVKRIPPCEHRFRHAKAGRFECDTCGMSMPQCLFKGCRGTIATVRKTSFSAGVALLDAHLFCEEHAMRKASIEKDGGAGLAQRYADATPAAKLEPGIVTCDVGADWED